jgi:DNA polymerase I-like protein with 3'-5' exonuclease and polymerase domains
LGGRNRNGRIRINVLALDTETPKFDKKEPWRGNVYGDSRYPVCYSAASANPPPLEAWAVKWGDDSVDEVQTEVDAADLVVGFNFKHDLAYLRREGVDFSSVKIWDVQIAEFLISRQRSKFPSLSDTCLRLGIPGKQDVVKEEYWDKGIDTIDIPWPVLSEYAANDAKITLEAYKRQLKDMTPAMRMLCSLQSQDLKILQEMEANGIPYDPALCAERAEKLDNEISQIKAELSAVYPTVAINFGSGDQLSAFLYGGTIYEEAKEHVGFFKTGAKAGQPKYKNVLIEHPLPRLFQPLKGSELAKEGFYATDEGTLKKLKGPKQKLLEKLLRLAKIEKLNGTYYRGLPKLNEEMHWPPGKLHGQFNQTLAGTGRLSSSKPNQQNFASELQDIFVSEFD